jgi:hypothetical protein
MAHQAQDTFVAEVNGAPVVVLKGSVWADTHALVKLDAGRGLLFKPLDLGEEEKEEAPVKRKRGRPSNADRAAAAAAAAVAEVPADDNGGE